MEKYQYQAQICLNGHCICSQVNKRPDLSQKFCHRCGAPTIDKCPECQAPIKGWDPSDAFMLLQGDDYIDYTPKHCSNCGESFPWIKTALEATKILILEENKVNEQEKNQLIESLPDLIVETPKTNLAISRTKRFLGSAGKFVAEGVRQFALDFACDLAKSKLGL